MRHVATLHVTEPLIRSAVMSFWRRSVGWKLIPVLALCGVLLIVLVRSGDRSWGVGVLGTALFFAVLFVALIYFVHLRQSLSKFRALKSPVATLVAEHDSFSIISDIGSSTFGWHALHDIWRFDSYWLLLFSRAQFVTLPVSDLPVEMQSYIQERFLALRSAHVG
jgi:hypothetical protein